MPDRADQEITYTLTYRDVIEILKFVRESEHCASFELQLGDLKLSVIRGASSLPEQPGARDAAPPVFRETSHRVEAGKGCVVAEPARADLVAVRAPVLGTFYRAPAPGAPPYVNVGDEVREGDTIGLIEVMKLFTPIAAGAAGRVVEIVAENAALVEYGQPLVLIEPL